MAHKNINSLRDKLSPGRVKKIKAKVQAMEAEMLLAELRKLEGITQAELAQRLGIKQPTLSQLEQQDDIQVSTLRRIVEALGGQLDLRVKLPKGEYKLGQFASY